MKKFLMSILVASTLFVSCKKQGCTDTTATNYNSEASKNDGSCKYSSGNGENGGTNPVNGTVLLEADFEFFPEGTSLHYVGYKAGEQQTQDAMVTGVVIHDSIFDFDIVNANTTQRFGLRLECESTPFQVGTYNFSEASDYQLVINSWKKGTGIYQYASSYSNQIYFDGAPVVRDGTLIISSINGTNVVGSFSGDIYYGFDDTGAELSYTKKMRITNCTFNIKVNIVP